MEGPGLTQRVNADGVLLVAFDFPGALVNLLSVGVLQELDRILDEARRLDEIRAILFASAKPRTFIAGPDVDQIAQVEDAFQGAEGARFGQAVLGKIASSRKPSACAINGICVGVGAEHCLHRGGHLNTATQLAEQGLCQCNQALAHLQNSGVPRPSRFR